MKLSFGSFLLPMLAAVVASAAGCVMGPSGRVAEEWEWVGPFKVFESKECKQTKPHEKPDQPAAPGSKDGARSTTPPGRVGGLTERGRTTSDASSNGIFSLRSADVDLGRGVGASGEVAGPATDAPEHSLFAPVSEVEDTFWYLDLGFRMGVTRLHETKQRLDRRLNLPLKLDVFGVFNRPTTPIDRKTDFGLTTAYIGIGRRETEWLTWNFYFGAGVGTDEDHQRRLNANLEVNFAYALYYTGMTVDIYPWGLSQRGRYVDYREHLKASRPYFVTGFEIGYLRARGWGHFALAPVRIYSDSQRVEDWLFSYLIGLGWEFPIDERWAFNLQVHYTFHFYRPDEYNSWNVTYALRYRF